MKIIVASSERFAGCMIPALLRAGHEVVGVVSPVQGIYDRQFEGLRFRFYDWVGWDMRKACSRHQIPLRVSTSLDDGAILAFFKQTQPDLLVIFSWPTLIGDTTLRHFSMGGMNIHPSLLPFLRGADPLFSLVDHYQLHFGVSFHQLAEALDAGPLYLQKALDFSPKQTYDDLYLKIIRAINRYLPTAIEQMVQKPQGRPQLGEPTIAQRFRKSDRYLEPHAAVSKVTRRSLACYSHHPMMTSLENQVFTFQSCLPIDLKRFQEVPNGTVFSLGLFSIIVKLGDGHAKLTGIRFPGKPWWQTPYLLIKHFRPGQQLGTGSETKALWRASLTDARVG